MDITLIEKLMKDMDASSLTKLEIEQDGFRICMEKGNSSVMPNQTASGLNQAADSIIISQKVEKPQEEIMVPANEVKEHHSYISSPMVGTFYSAAGPNQAAYVKVGDFVKKGQIVCIIESMKLMNEIEADVEGEVCAILVSDKDMVEYGQKMFEILPR